MKALVLFSGGIDSSTALAMAVEKYGSDEVIALSCFYGQKHDREIEAAKNVAAHYGVKQKILNLAKIFEGSDSALLKASGEDIPKESYVEGKDKEGLISTYVPFRNGLFLSVAASVAQANGCEVIYYGAHKDDAAGAAYPDCTPQFNEAMAKGILEGTGHEVRLEAPFINANKADVVRMGLALGVPYELTWSCYEGGDKPCGKCATCIDRKKAFEENGVKDPAGE